MCRSQFERAISNRDAAGAMPGNNGETIPCPEKVVALSTDHLALTLARLVCECRSLSPDPSHLADHRYPHRGVRYRQTTRSREDGTRVAATIGLVLETFKKFERTGRISLDCRLRIAGIRLYSFPSASVGADSGYSVSISRSSLSSNSRSRRSPSSRSARY